MKTYKLTAFEANGEKIVDESFQAEHDEAAKEIAEKMLAEKNLLEKTHRCTSPERQVSTVSILRYRARKKKPGSASLFLLFIFL